jgi:hypothetical protein
MEGGFRFENLATESKLKLNHYSVSKCSEKERQNILSLLILNNIISKVQIINHLSWLIDLNMFNPRINNAVPKWRTSA